MRVHHALLIATATVSLLSVAHPALAQSIPEGACLLPTGEWCWPIATTPFGAPCTCPDGRVGVRQ